MYVAWRHGVAPPSPSIGVPSIKMNNLPAVLLAALFSTWVSSTTAFGHVFRISINVGRQRRSTPDFITFTADVD